MSRFPIERVIVATCLPLLVGACEAEARLGDADGPQPPVVGLGGAVAATGVAVVRGTDGHGEVEGTVRFEPVDGGLAVSVRLEGLEPGSTHGFHVHQHGDCSASDASSAGGHFAPDGNDHALPPERPRHAGDLGNVTADADGGVDVTRTIPRLDLLRGEEAIVGRAVILHAAADDGEGASGHAGPRIGCGVIGRDAS